MALEIERKFLLKNENWQKHVDRSTKIKQGYLNTDPERTVRVRTRNEQAFLTIKGKTIHTSRVEFEYEIPYEEALSLLKLCEKPLIEKTRFVLEYHGKVWEIDQFEGENEGLIIAEIELTHEDEAFPLPSWIGMEVSHDARYYNAALINNPFRSWK